MARILKTSDDGSHTVFNESINETYHSVFGAITESEYVFINACYLLLKKEKTNVLEVGFGTGLNAWLTLVWAEKLKRHTYYESYEFYPLEEQLIANLNFATIKYSENSHDLKEIHTTGWNTVKQLTPYYSIKKANADFTKTKLSGNYDAVFFDAFSPEKQPEMWTYEVFNKIFNAMSPVSILTTYCAKGVVKRLLKEVGFTIELIPGPPGKRHMIRALKG